MTPDVVLLVAGPGYGKTAWIEANAPTDQTVVPATALSRDLLDRLARDDVRLAVEDLHVLEPSAALDLVSDLASRRWAGPLILSSQVPLGEEVRRLLPGRVLERGPGDLALSPPTVARLLIEDYGLTDPDLPAMLHAAAAGWPRLVHLLADAFVRHDNLARGVLPRDLPELLEHLVTADSPIAAWLEHSVLAAASASCADLLRALAGWDVVTSDLLRAVWEPEDVDSWVSDAFSGLRRSGLVVPHPRWAIVGRRVQRVVPALAAHLTRAGVDPGLDEHLDVERQRRAASWYERHDHPMAAVRARLRCGADADGDRLLAASAPRMVAQGDGQELLRLLALPGRELSPESTVRKSQAEALVLVGRLGDAEAVLRPLVRQADLHGWDASLANLLAWVGYAAGDYAAAREVLDRVAPPDVRSGAEGARWRLLRTTIGYFLGDPEGARGWADDALRFALETQDDDALCSAHQALGLVHEGQQQLGHLEAAAEHARRAGSVVAVAPILCNQSDTLLTMARYVEAAEVAAEGVVVCERVRPIGALLVSLVCLAQAQVHLGRFDEARWHLDRAVALGRRLGPTRAASALAAVGDLHRALDQRIQARQAYQEAIELTRDPPVWELLVPSMSGQVRVVCQDDPHQAQRLAQEAVSVSPSRYAAYAYAALAWSALALGDRAAAREAASLAASHARDHHQVEQLAEALEVSAMATEDVPRARELLLDSRSIWVGAAATPSIDRIDVRLARLETADREVRERGRAAGDRLRRMGVTGVLGEVRGDDPTAKEVGIRVLGVFGVTVAGVPVPAASWRSRQARTLVKLLASRPGQPVRREQVGELLWPGVERAKTSHRLSVLLTTVRSVLDPDRTWPPDRYLAADAAGVSLDLRRAEVDLDELVSGADEGARLVALGDLAGAHRVLGRVDALYRGEAFADEPDAAWATRAREEARGAWLRSLHHLAMIATVEGSHVDAVALLGRLLLVDPYDDSAHHALVESLVRAGRHGEARRAFERWTAAMAELDVPGPDRCLLTGSVEQTVERPSRGGGGLTRG